MRVLGASVLALEAIVVILAIPVAVVVSGVPAWIGITAGAVLAIALLVLARYVTRPWAIPVGWGLQVLVVLTGFFAPPMFVVGGIFALLWGLAIRLGRAADGSGADGSAEPPGPAGG